MHDSEDNSTRLGGVGEMVLAVKYLLSLIPDIYMKSWARRLLHVAPVLDI